MSHEQNICHLSWRSCLADYMFNHRSSHLFIVSAFPCCRISEFLLTLFCLNIYVQELRIRIFHSALFFITCSITEWIRHTKQISELREQTWNQSHEFELRENEQTRLCLQWLLSQFSLWHLLSIKDFQVAYMKDKNRNYDLNALFVSAIECALWRFGKCLSTTWIVACLIQLTEQLNFVSVIMIASSMTFWTSPVVRRTFVLNVVSIRSRNDFSGSIFASVLFIF